MNNDDLHSWMRHADERDGMTLVKSIMALTCILAILAFCVFISS